jgi:hypothetical protein
LKIRKAISLVQRRTPYIRISELRFANCRVRKSRSYRYHNPDLTDDEKAALAQLLRRTKDRVRIKSRSTSANLPTTASIKERGALDIVAKAG